MGFEVVAEGFTRLTDEIEPNSEESHEVGGVVRTRPKRPSAQASGATLGQHGINGSESPMELVLSDLMRLLDPGAALNHGLHWNEIYR